MTTPHSHQSRWPSGNVHCHCTPLSGDWEGAGSSPTVGRGFSASLGSYQRAAVCWANLGGCFGNRVSSTYGCAYRGKTRAMTYRLSVGMISRPIPQVDRLPGPGDSGIAGDIVTPLEREMVDVHLSRSPIAEAPQQKTCLYVRKAVCPVHSDVCPSIQNWPPKKSVKKI